MAVLKGQQVATPLSAEEVAKKAERRAARLARLKGGEESDDESGTDEDVDSESETDTDTGSDSD
jgi:hypothetical protein